MAADIFISYAEKDQELCDELLDHLAPLDAEIFTRGKIQPGAEWSREVSTALDQAPIVLLLISAKFIASSFSRSQEMQRAIKRHDNGSAVVVPVILSHCMWKGMPFSKLQALPAGAKPVTKWPDRDEALCDVAQGISEVLEKLRREARSVDTARPSSPGDGAGDAARAPVACPPFKMIANALHAGEMMVFLGAGASAGKDGWEPGGDVLPRPPELARHLLTSSGYQATEHGGLAEALPWVSTCVEGVSERSLLDDQLHAIFAAAAEPGDLHRLLAGLPNLMVVTLGWDRLLEKALRDREQPFHQLVYLVGGPAVQVWAAGADKAEEVAPSDVDKVLDIDWMEDHDPVIFQLCGVAERERGRRQPLVATERDLVELLQHLPSGLPAPLARPFGKRHHLVLGCDLESWAERMVLDQIWHTWERKGAAWAIHDAMLPLERDHWAYAHKLRVFEMPLEDFVTELVREDAGG